MTVQVFVSTRKYLSTNRLIQSFAALLSNDHHGNLLQVSSDIGKTCTENAPRHLLLKSCLMCEINENKYFDMKRLDDIKTHRGLGEE